MKPAQFFTLVPKGLNAGAFCRAQSVTGRQMYSQRQEFQRRSRVRRFTIPAICALPSPLSLGALWITAAHGDIELPRWGVSILRSHPYGPPHPLYGGWMWAAAFAAAASVSIVRVCYAIYRIARAAPQAGDE